MNRLIHKCSKNGLNVFRDSYILILEELIYFEVVKMSTFLMKPKIDFAFKEIMMNENARIGFLSAILKLNPKDIQETQILNTNLRKLHEDDKQGILDVRILMNNKMEIDIEIQLSELKVWADRSLFYLSKMYVEQIKAGEKYNVFKRCVSISILDFTLFEDIDDFYSCFHIREDNRHTLYTDKMEFHVLELSKLPKELKEDTSDILLLAKFINAEAKEEFDMLATKNPYIESAYEQLQIISQDKKKRLEYEAREKAIRDYNQMMFEAEERGEKRGIEQGQYQKAIIIAKNLLSMALPLSAIIQATGLSEEEIKKLQ